MADNKRPIEPAYSVAVYDGATGEVLLIHHFGAMPGVALPDSKKLHEIAIKNAVRVHKRETGSMEALKIEASGIAPKRSYRVSLPDRRLVEDQLTPPK